MAIRFIRDTINNVLVLMQGCISFEEHAAAVMDSCLQNSLLLSSLTIPC